LIKLIGQLKLNIEWLHFGSGNMEQGFLLETNNLPSNIKFTFAGHVNNSDLLDYYKRNPVDLFVNVSEFEGIPVTLMEAISFGIPIVGCRVGGVAEIVNDSTGLLLDKDFDITEVANKIDQFLQFKARTKETREKVKQFWALNFDAEVNANIFVNEILNLK
jgi:glycosyltransferase involved in cell wall biosynthesis